MSKILCATFLLGLKAENDAKIKADTIKAIGENLQSQVISYATQGKRFVQIQVNNIKYGMITERFLDENMADVFNALSTNYFDESVKIEVKKMFRNPDARGNISLWVDLDELPPIHYLRSGGHKLEYVFQLSW